MASYFDRQPRFTVMIPTRNRAPYLEYTLKTCMMQDYENLAIVVADDGSTDNTRDLVLALAQKDGRIKYHPNHGNPGMRDNFERALNQADDGYVIALGGDDGLMPDGIRGMLDVLQQTQLDMVAWGAPLYSYPGVRGSDGQLMLYHPKKDKIVSSQKYLHRQADQLQYLSDIESPMFYVKGVVSTRLVRRVQARHPNGRFYQCPTPDGYSGIVLAGEVEQYAFSGHPFAIYGLSPTSQGLNYLANDGQAKSNSESFFESVESVPMHKNLASQPYSPLIALMTADYLLTASDLNGWPGPIPSINYKNLISICIAELSHGLYGQDRLVRELHILDAVARQHGLEKYFVDKLKRAQRKKAKMPFSGNGVNHRAIFMDASQLKIKNIIDAAHAAQHLIPFYADLMPGRLSAAIIKSAVYFLRSIGRGGKFPVINQRA